MNLLVVLTPCHLDPVQFLFDLMKGVVPDLVVGAHDEDRLPGRFQSCAMQFAVRGARSRIKTGTFARQTRRELLPEKCSDR
jgi:hypothetical protein